MPIRFRCPHCSKLLGIATRKAGTAITCPKCEQSVTVPQPGDAAPGGELDEIDQLLGNPAPAATAPVAAPSAAPRRKSGDSLFETGDVDQLLGFTSSLPSPVEPTPRPAAPRPGTGADVLSLDDPNAPWVLSPAKVALLVVAVVALLGVAFAAGFVIANML